MTGFAFVTGLLIALVLLGLNAIIGLIPAVCMVFTIVFWGSLTILAGNILCGTIAGIASRDVSIFTGIAGGGICICLCGLAIALCIFIAAVFLDAARLVLAIIGLDGQAPITMERLFFPWKS